MGNDTVLPVVADHWDGRAAGFDDEPDHGMGQPDAQPDPDADHGDYTPIHTRLPWYGGVTPDALAAALDPLVADIEVHDLADDDVLWGHAVTDIRFALIARAATP